MFLCIGTAKAAQVNPKKCQQAFFLLYRILDGGKSLEFVHRTETSQIPLAVLGFQGRLLVGVGGALRIYEIGKKKCLRKAEVEVSRNAIVQLHTQGDRIIAADNIDSVHYVVFKEPDNRLILFANDSVSRWCSATTMVDYDTIAGGDKFGNIWIVRCPQETSDLSDSDAAGGNLIHERPYLMGAAHRLDTICHFHIGDIPTSITKTTLMTGGRPVLVITGLMGSISLLIPFIAKEDVEFFTALEVQLRALDPPLAGRDHMVYRGYYCPPRAVIDGDLCERFMALSNDSQARVGAELDRDVSEIKAKIERIRPI